VSTLNETNERLDPVGLHLSEKIEVLKVAREAITAAVRGAQPAPLRTQTEALARNAGVFVTLHEEGDLRGCIGYIEPVMPLLEATQDAAVKAALEDPRFEPVQAKELPQITIEISVLSPVEICSDLRQIQVGLHGLIMESGRRRGLLLPQVATEYGWDREQFLEQTAIKAGLPRNAWKSENVTVHTFTVEKFSESDVCSKNVTQK
jgi:AmmeMemoRadiSam system protein A